MRSVIYYRHNSTCKLGVIRKETVMSLFGMPMGCVSFQKEEESFSPKNREFIFPAKAEVPVIDLSLPRKGAKQVFSISWKSLIITTVVILLSVFGIGFFSSCSSEDDELKVDTQLLVSLKDGTTSIDGMVYIFPDGDYDPNTFMVSTFGSIETKTGEKVTGIGAGSYHKNGGYCEFDCDPGSYYVLGVYLGKSSWGGMPHQTWKGQKATVAKNKMTIVEIKLSTFSSGCQN